MLAFAFTSVGVKIDHTVTPAAVVLMLFKINGELHHLSWRPSSRRGSTTYVCTGSMSMILQRPSILEAIEIDNLLPQIMTEASGYDP